MTSLLLRADATPSLGVGHLSRCVALATAARARGWDVALCGTFTAGQWLLGDLPVVPTLRPADVVLVDHYGLGPVSLPSLLVSMEDGEFGRRRADIVVDANLYTTPRPDDGSPVVLRGPAYAPLRAEIRAARTHRAATWAPAAPPDGSPPQNPPAQQDGESPPSKDAAAPALRDGGPVPPEGGAAAVLPGGGSKSPEDGAAAALPGGGSVSPEGGAGPALPGDRSVLREGGAAAVLPGEGSSSPRGVAVSARRGGGLAPGGVVASAWSGGPAGLPKVVVVMGGGAAPSAVAAAVAALRETGVPASVVAVSSAPVPGVEVIPPTPELPSLFAAADLVVSAAGVTLMELCCIGVPAALVQIADNQKAGYTAAVDQGLAAGLGTDPREHVATLRTLLLQASTRKALADKAMDIVDGRGAERVLDAIEQALAGRRTERTDVEPAVRPATRADSALLLAWRNDPETRARSRTTDPVSPQDHEAWLARVLADPDRLLLLAEHGHQPVGTVRFDRDGDHWEISITVAPEARGRKLAVPILLVAERALPPGATVHACVHQDNHASRTIFLRAGYRGDRTDGEWLWFAKTV